jgi:hypothetical protein
VPIEIISPDIAFFCVLKPRRQVGRSQPHTKLHVVITQKTLIWIFTAMKKDKTYIISADFQFHISQLERQTASMCLYQTVASALCCHKRYKLFFKDEERTKYIFLANLQHPNLLSRLSF